MFLRRKTLNIAANILLISQDSDWAALSRHGPQKCQLHWRSQYLLKYKRFQKPYSFHVLRVGIEPLSVLLVVVFFIMLGVSQLTASGSTYSSHLCIWTVSSPHDFCVRQSIVKPKTVPTVHFKRPCGLLLAKLRHDPPKLEGYRIHYRLRNCDKCAILHVEDRGSLRK